ncbi:MAG: hypothetical protein HYU64_00190 [Armatimonadetes bacterium]|nr:hypothetical protein [Armatimonadota bacterium]
MPALSVKAQKLRTVRKSRPRYQLIISDLFEDDLFEALKDLCLFCTVFVLFLGALWVVG